MHRRDFIRSAASASMLTALTGSARDAKGEPRAATAPNEAATQASSPDPGPGLKGQAPGLYYAPIEGRVGDVIPFYDGQQFRVFHLYHANGEHGGTTWQQVSTSDFVHFTQHGTMLPRGAATDQDPSVATGSVVQDAQGLYHAFYTGYNSPLRATRPEQGVMHATSRDLLHWSKHPADTFFAPTDQYEKDDWRDPFVFWNAEAKQYWMLIAARLKRGPERRRGCTALAVSHDLHTWQVKQPFWAPGLYFTHECPDLFRMGDWWYLLFSEFSQSNQTRYRKSRSPAGPWIAPEDEVFDTRALYAAKTASDGGQRYLFGWNPRRHNADDSEFFEWGGTLVVHSLLQRPNGDLYVGLPTTIHDAFSRPQPLQPFAALGKSQGSAAGLTLMAAGTYALETLCTMPAVGRVSGELAFSQGTIDFGLALHLADDLDNGHFLRLEPARQRMVWDRWKRPGDAPFVLGFERPLVLAPGKPVRFDLIVSETIAVLYIAGQTAMSTRMYQPGAGKLGLFATGGAVTLRHLEVRQMMDV